MAKTLKAGAFTKEELLRRSVKPAGFRSPGDKLMFGDTVSDYQPFEDDSDDSDEDEPRHETPVEIQPQPRQNPTRSRRPEPTIARLETAVVDIQLKIYDWAIDEYSVVLELADDALSFKPKLYGEDLNLELPSGEHMTVQLAGPPLQFVESGRRILVFFHATENDKNRED